jgi:probable rRNA maturation factor
VSIYFNSISNNFEVQKPLVLKKWINSAFKSEGVEKKVELNVIFCTDEELLDINKKFLNHDYYTDIVTFPIEETDSAIEAEIYMSIDRIKDNALNEGVHFSNEFNRVLIHGVLHLCGYKDKTHYEKQLMRVKETDYLSLLK